MKLTFLGTGSAVPTAKKNHPAILLSFRNENILFDCGEGTQRQFRKVRISPTKLTRIFITHWHGDHVLGIPGLLYTLNLNEYSGTLKIYGPKGTKKYMERIMETYDSVNNLNIEINEISEGKVVEEKDFEIYAEEMEHGINCLAYKFVEKDKLRIDKDKLKKLKIGNLPELKKITEGKNVIVEGRKIKAKDLTYLQKGKSVAIVLDTKENKNILKIAKKVDVFICEATFFDELKIANEYKHLTVGQVAKIAKKARVKMLVLTHLSQRYEKDEKKFLEVAKKIFKDTILAKDLMKLEI
jgi:ribonuclease Z